MTYPEFEPLVHSLANEVCDKINQTAPSIESEMIYKRGYVLEELIKELQKRV